MSCHVRSFTLDFVFNIPEYPHVFLFLYTFLYTVVVRKETSRIKRSVSGLGSRQPRCHTDPPL